MPEQERTLDWRPNFDERNMLHRFAALDCYFIGAHRAQIIRKKTVWLNQYQEGACTGFGEEHVRALTPYPGSNVSNVTARAMYLEAQKQDEWPGEDYEGSSVNGAMKAARLMGKIRAWRWAYNMDEVKHGLSYHSAAEIGINWWSGMWNPDSQGFLHVTGSRVGGHALALAGFKKDASGQYIYRLENSWGQEWGDNGGAWVTEDDLQKLMSDDGEFAFPVKFAT